MLNITHKVTSLRKAVALAIVTVSTQETIDTIQQNKVPKGNVFEFAKVAGLLAVKNTSNVIPDCHPLPIEYTSINYTIENVQIIITVEVHTIYKTGVEVEAMHGASIVALTMYDMLKPIDKNIEISTVKLLSKSGGKSQYKLNHTTALRIAVIVCSDSVAVGTAQDFTGKAIVKKLHQLQLNTTIHEVIADDFLLIQNKAIQLSADGFDLLIFTGGTGLSPRDVTPEAIAPLIDRDIPGIMESARQYGQQRTPYAMLSRGVAGFINKTLVLTLPGSTRGAEETMDALFPYIIHLFKVSEGMRHD